MYQRMLTALSKRIKVEYLTVNDLTDREFDLYIDFLTCHYFTNQAF